MTTLFEQLALLTPERRQILQQKLSEQGLAPLLPNSISRRPPHTATPLSFAQQRLWFVQQFDPRNTAYNVGSVFDLGGALNVAAMRASLGALIERHEILRTRFAPGADGKLPVQIVEAPPTDLLPLIETADIRQARAHVAELTDTAFDLEQVPLRTALLRLAPDRHWLVIATHHIASDRWSIGVFLRELALLYHSHCRHQLAPLPAMPIQYGDWAVWQQQNLSGDNLQSLSAFWLARLSGDRPELALPYTGKQRHAGPRTEARQALQLPPALSQALRERARQSEVTLFSVLLTACKVLLRRYTGSDDIIVGTDIANRDRPETENLIGLLVNTLVLRSDLGGNPRFLDALSTVRGTVLDAFAHQALPFEKLVELINPERRPDQLTPLFQVKFDLQQAEVKPIELDGLRLERLPPRELQAKYELRFNLQDGEAGIGGQIEYSRELFDADTIAAMARHYAHLLESICRNPDARLSELALLERTEIEQRLFGLNQTRQDYDRSATLTGLYERQALATPDAVAIYDGATSLSYTELNRRADAIASQLRAAGASRETPVGICMPRTARLLVGLLAILKTGACYVALDPDYPAERLRYLKDDSGMKIIVVDAFSEEVEALRGLAAVRVRIGNDSLVGDRTSPSAPPLAGDTAYIIYTSGSTGQPKGVAIEHRSAAALLYWAADEYSRDDLNGVLAATSICFDLSVFELFLPLSRGGRVVLVDNLPALAKLPADVGISLINTVPSVLTGVLNHAGIPDSVRVINLAGEAFPPLLLKRLLDMPHIERVYNLYGPSEDTTYSTWARFDRATDTSDMTSVPIGRPIANTQAYVLDAERQWLPFGAVGELYLGGDGLARGYRGRPELTAESFVENPFAAQGAPSPRLYRTGDRVRQAADGTLEFLGRYDDQVKIRGYRIETGEIDHLLRSHPRVSDVFVTTFDNGGSRELIAYLETGEHAPTFAELRDFLSQRLPAYLVPNHLPTLAALPKLPNGKIDRRALPAPDFRQSDTAFAAPRDATEQALTQIWQTVLQRDGIGIHDNFFHLGGHSLLAIEIVARIEQVLAWKPPLRALFEQPTIAGLAALRQTSPAPTSGVAALSIDAAARFQPFPLTEIQQAYLIGRNAAFELGNIGTHAYREIEVSGLSVAAVEAALNRLIARHDMLRMVVTADNQQRVLAQTPEYRIACHDAAADDARPSLLDGIRARLSHQIFDPQVWPLFQIEATILPAGRLRFYLSFDVLIGDAWSFQLLGREMALLLRGGELPPLALGFRDCVLAEQQYTQTGAYQQAWRYWQQRLPALPPAPELPLAAAPGQIRDPRFSRRCGGLPVEAWQRLQARGRRHGLTASAIALAAFAESLGEFARHPAFTLNLTLFNRPPLHPDINRIVGDFTSSLLLGLSLRADESFAELAGRVQARLWSDIEHRAVGGVRILRELAQNRGRQGGALMPVVFTSTLNQTAPSQAPDDWRSEVVYSVSQTSQVYLDHQVSEVDGGLRCNWDVIEALFPVGLLDTLCQRHQQRLSALAEPGPQGDEAWATPPDHGAILKRIAALNATGQPLFDGNPPLLHALFFAAADRYPQRPAVLSNSRDLSYAELAAEARQLAAELQRLGARPNELVAVGLAKGWQQAVAVLGILAAGAAYVPIDPALPKNRRAQLLADTEVRYALVADDCLLDWPGPLQLLRIAANPQPNGAVPELPATAPSDLAYVIYTSGSTGMPKGVMIDHRGAANTVLDINKRYGITADDRVFGLSSLSFDLSVYDLFGTFAAGAALVLPDNESLREPRRWLDMLASHKVSVWNSVPALMQLLVDVCPADYAGDSLRLALLSGDWISLTLPDAIRRRFPASRVISLGGATEASIWSIEYPVDRVFAEWRSIPYGHPLANQQWFVLDDLLRPRQTWAIGQLYIAGTGLARGYWRRPELSAERFSPNPYAGADGAGPVLYKTGDLGRYLPDGSIELLGREDNQVKINGYRVELGEIEAVLQQHPALTGAAVVAAGQPPALAAFVVLTQSPTDRATLNKLDFKMARGQRPAPGLSGVVAELPPPQAPQALLDRQSHRRFLPEPVPLAAFSQWLAALKAWPLADAPLAKFRYPSAGNLYPVMAYLEIKAGRIQGLNGGWYYYHPDEHRLHRLHAFAWTPDVSGENREIHAASAFAVYLLAYLPPLTAAYGDNGRDLALLEAGYAGQLLMSEAPAAHLGLCPIGGAALRGLSEALAPDGDFAVVHALYGGAIEPAWNTRWQALAPAAGASFEEKLQDWLRERLPAYMVPTRIRLLDKLPLSANGKLDRTALPTAEAERADYQAPQTASERGVVELWQNVLNAQRIGLDDDFFAVGGNSLQAMQLAGKLRERFGVDLTLSQLFSALTPRRQAELVDRMRREQPADAPAAIAAIERIPRQTTIDDLADREVDALLAALLDDPARES